jgi:hypothetical protein
MSGEAQGAKAAALLPGWGSTLLFALSPLPQLVSTALRPLSTGPSRLARPACTRSCATSHMPSAHARTPARAPAPPHPRPPAVPRQVRNFVDPQSLAGLSVGTMLLALLGNALMVPRALLVRDAVWLLGCSWACVAGWGQLLSMFMRTAPATG